MPKNAFMALGLGREPWAGDTSIEFLNAVMERSFLSVPDCRGLDPSDH